VSVTPHGIPVAEAEFLTAAGQAMGTGDGDAALDALGWWDLLGGLDDPELRTAVFTVFRAQGRALAGSVAVGGLAAQPYLAGTAIAPGTVVAALPRRTTDRGTVHVVVGELGDRKLLIDRPGEGAAIFDHGTVGLRGLGVLGDLRLHEVTDVDAGGATLLDDAVAAPRRAESTRLGRIALAYEIAGAAERALDLAVEHATAREQFGAPIGTFQAVRHLLAWASADIVAITSLARQSILLGSAAPARYDEVLKALAGRNGRKACERSLQVLGGIGFTAEHDHHRSHQRVLALDALLGSSADLTRELGAWLRTTQVDPRFASSVLVPAPS
jgi:hypothetical protein